MSEADGIVRAFVASFNAGTAVDACTHLTLLTVTVRFGETTSGIDLIDWFYDTKTVSYPPRPTR